MSKPRNIEIFIDGKFKKAVKTFKALETFIYKYHEKENWEEIMSSHGGDYGYYIFLDHGNMSSVCISWKTFTGFYDKHNKKIYENTILKNEDGKYVQLNYADKDTVNSVLFSSKQRKIGWYFMIDEGRSYSYQYINSEKETKKLEIYKTY